jgi:hypothetical protein
MAKVEILLKFICAAGALELLEATLLAIELLASELLEIELLIDDVTLLLLSLPQPPITPSEQVIARVIADLGKFIKCSANMSRKIERMLYVSLMTRW